MNKKERGDPLRNRKECEIMNSTNKMIGMLAEALETALGEEWRNMSEQQQHDEIMNLAKLLTKALDNMKEA